MHLKFKNLIEIVAKLRSPEGCPWDREQTLESMKEHLKEETGEVLEAIDSGKAEDITEEMGDVLSCLLIMAQIAKEDRLFDMGDVMDTLAEKLISRHTWVFGTDSAKTPEDALKLWLKNKEKEKAKKSKKKS